MGKFKKINKALFLDRDGTINKARLTKGKPYPPRSNKNLKFITGITDLIHYANKKKYIVIVITNQPDFERGLTTKKNIISINKLIKKKFKIKKIYTCYSSLNSNFFKKPNPGMIFQAKKDYNIDLNKSFLIGDTWKDILAGKKANVKTILLKRKYNLKIISKPNYIVKNLKKVIPILQ